MVDYFTSNIFLSLLTSEVVTNNSHCFQNTLYFDTTKNG